MMELRWEYCPLRVREEKGGGSGAGAGAGAGAGRRVSATVSTSPPSSSTTRGQLFGAAYAIPKLCLVEMICLDGRERESGVETTTTTDANGEGKKKKKMVTMMIEDKGEAFVVLNCYDMLYIMAKEDPESSPAHTINFGGVCPTCHACQQATFAAVPPQASDHDYAVGLATGEILSFSMRHHIEQNLGGGKFKSSEKGGSGGGGSTKTSAFSSIKQSKVKISAVQYYNRDRAVDTGRCTAVAWSPRSVSNSNSSTSNSARVLVAAFADGSLHVYSPNGGVLATSSAVGDPQRTPTKSGGAEGKDSASQKSKETSGSSSQNSGGSSFFSSLKRSSKDSSGSQGELGKDQSQPNTPRGGSDSSSDSALVVQWNVCDCAINSVAFSSNGYQLACVSCDGVLRIFDVGSGTLRAGCRSYFGGYLCVSWSHDGRFVVCAGEDDLVEIFSIADNSLVAFGEGHSSWVSDLAFWSVTEQQQQQDIANNAAGDSGEDQGQGGEEQFKTRMYKFVSVAQDTQLAFWEFEAPDEISGSLHEAEGGGSDPTGTPTRPRHRRWISTGGTNSTPISISISNSNDNLENAFDDLKLASKSLIADSVPRAHMNMIPSVAQQEAHNEPLSAVLKCKDGIITLCFGGVLKYWTEKKD